MKRLGSGANAYICSLNWSEVNGIHQAHGWETHLVPKIQGPRRVHRVFNDSLESALRHARNNLRETKALVIDEITQSLDKSGYLKKSALLEITRTDLDSVL